MQVALTSADYEIKVSIAAVGQHNGTYLLKDCKMIFAFKTTSKDRHRVRHFLQMLGRQAEVLDPDQVFDRRYQIIDDISGQDDALRILPFNRQMQWYKAIEYKALSRTMTFLLTD